MSDPNPSQTPNTSTAAVAEPPGAIDRGRPVDPASKSMDDLVALCKRRGFVYPASEIYGGIRGFWDYGPLGVELKNAIRDWWWQCMVKTPPIGPDGNPVEIVGLDSAIIQHPKTWESSGHVAGFNDPMVDCTETNKRYRADHIVLYEVRASSDNSVDGELVGYVGTVLSREEVQAEMDNKKLWKRLRKAFGIDDLEVSLGDPRNETIYTDIPEFRRALVLGPDATKPGTLTEPRAFNLMLDTYPGPIRDEDNKAYLRPETAQGIFLNFKNVLDTSRVKVPFGIAQIGKSFRNEVTPRNFIFRSREFEQMEMEFFYPPDQSQQWYEFWREARYAWWKTLGIHDSNLILRDHDDDELAHYSDACVDVEYRYPFTAPGFGELEGIAHRGCFDLTAHKTGSGKDLSYFDQALQLKLNEQGVPAEDVTSRSRYVPHVIEPASGLTRAVLVLLCEAFTPTPERSGSAYVMSFKPRFAPVKAGVFPLVNKDGMPEIAHKLYLSLREKFDVEYDAKQSIGKRYARMDEIGTPFCFTIDGDTLPGGEHPDTVTVRDRDTLAQERIHLSQVEAYLSEKLRD